MQPEWYHELVRIQEERENIKLSEEVKNEELDWSVCNLYKKVKDDKYEFNM